MIQKPSEHTPLIEWALFYAKLHKSIIPLYETIKNGECACLKKDCTSIGKHPRVKNGLKDATTDLTIITDWWTKWPYANIGIATGSISGIIVLDIDPRHGGENSLNTLQSRHGQISANVVKSGGNGWHFYFDIGPHEVLKNKVNFLPGCDIRGEGGYIVAPPSNHASGFNYKWIEFDDTKYIVPKWLYTYIEQKKSLNNSLNLITHNTVGQGSRNVFLASLAGVLRKYGFDQKTMSPILKEFNITYCNPSLLENEVLSIVSSVSRYDNADVEVCWDTIKMLPNTEHQVPAMDPSFIPNRLKEWVLDVAGRLNVPIEFILTPSIVSIGAIIGRKIRIYPYQNDDWQVVPNLWGAIVSRPGTLKSPSIAEALKPIESIVEIENKIFAEKMSAWEFNKGINDATVTALKEQLIKAIKQNNAAETEILKEKLNQFRKTITNIAPICKRVKTNDTTVEKLAQIFSENPNGILIVRDELAGWLVSLEKYGREGDREFYLDAWSSKGSYTIDRIGRGTLEIPALCLSIFGGIQPDKLKKLMTNSLSDNDDGLLQRFQLLIYPDFKKEWKKIDRHPNVEAQDKIKRFLQDVHAIQTDVEIRLRFSLSAQELFYEWREELENLLISQNSINPHYESHLSKYRSLLPALALIFHVISIEPAELSTNTIVSEESLILAKKWCAYLKEHSKKIYQVNQYPYYKSVESFRDKLLARKISDGMKVRDLLRNYWANLKTSEQVENTLSFLAEYNWLKIIECSSEYQGRPTRIIKLHPDLLKTLETKGI